MEEAPDAAGAVNTSRHDSLHQRTNVLVLDGTIMTDT